MRGPLRRGRRGHRGASAGFTFLGLLFLIALMGMMAAAAATTWAFTGQRDKEEQLLFVGHAYRIALTRYAQAHVASPQPYPTSLAQLLGDTNNLTPRRFLRRLYHDPMTGSDDWGLVKNEQGGIIGVHSLSMQTPIRTQPIGFDEGIAFAQARSYRDWVFNARGVRGPGQRRPAPPGWNYDTDGEPPLTWEDAPPAPVIVPEPG